MKLSNSKDIRVNNKSNILFYLLRHQTASRTDLAKELHLSPATITLLVDELRAEGMVEEFAVGNFTGGRKPILLKLSCSKTYVLVLQPYANTLGYCAMDLSQQVIAEDRIPYPEASLSNDLFSCIVETVDRLSKIESIRGRSLVGISLILSETLDTSHHVAVETDAEIHMLDIENALNLKYGIQVRIEHIAQAKALSHFYQAPKGCNSILYVNLDKEIQAIRVLRNGDLVPRLEAVPGFEHLVSDMNGIPCDCGMTGCLQTTASIPAIYAAMCQALNTPANLATTQTSEMISYIEKSQNLCADILEKTMHALLVACHNSSVLLGTKQIVLGGELTAMSWFQPMLRNGFLQGHKIAKHITIDSPWRSSAEAGSGRFLVECCFSAELSPSL